MLIFRRMIPYTRLNACFSKRRVVSTISRVRFSRLRECMFIKYGFGGGTYSVKYGSINKSL